MAHAKPSPDLLVAFQKEFRRPVEAAEEKKKKVPRLRIILELDGAPEVRVLFLRTDPVANNHPAVPPLVLKVVGYAYYLQSLLAQTAQMYASSGPSLRLCTSALSLSWLIS